MSAAETRFPVTPEAIAEAAALIRRGGLVAFPTETVYGLGADATSDAAVAAVFAVKDRPRFNPLIVHVSDTDAAEALAAFDDRARFLAGKFWPGPLTLVLPRRADSGLSLLVSAGLDTVAIRVPAHSLAQALLTAANRPIAAPSANPSGAVSPTTAAHVAEALGDRVAMILDGGRCRVGVESTVVDLTGGSPVLLRPGGLATEAISVSSARWRRRAAARLARRACSPATTRRDCRCASAPTPPNRARRCWLSDPVPTMPISTSAATATSTRRRPICSRC